MSQQIGIIWIEMKHITAFLRQTERHIAASPVTAYHVVYTIHIHTSVHRPYIIDNLGYACVRQMLHGSTAENFYYLILKCHICYLLGHNNILNIYKFIVQVHFKRTGHSAFMHRCL